MGVQCVHVRDGVLNEAPFLCAGTGDEGIM